MSSYPVDVQLQESGRNLWGRVPSLSGNELNDSESCVYENQEVLRMKCWPTCTEAGNTDPRDDGDCFPLSGQGQTKILFMAIPENR